MGNMKKVITLAIAMMVVATTALAGTHTVAKGENDYTIAKKYGISLDQLHKLNPQVKWSSLQIGQKLTVSKETPKPKQTTQPKAKAQVVGQKVSGKIAEIVKTDVILRSGPGTTYDRIALLNKGQKADVIEFKGDWYKVKFSSGTTGWIRNDMVSVKAKPANMKPATSPKEESTPDLPETPDGNSTNRPLITNVSEEETKRDEVAAPAMPVNATSAPLKIEITGDRVNIRKDATTSSAKIVTVTQGRVADVLLQKNGWYKVKFAGGTIGWVHGDFAKPTSADAKDPEPSAKMVASGAAGDLIDTAKDQIGVRYSWGGTSRGGFDCSGFVQYVFAKNGVKLPRTSISQSQTGSKVAKSDLQVGDLVFFITRGSRVSHVGIFIGNGNFIHASSGGGQVRIDSLSKDYYAKRYAGARRVGKFNKSVVDSAKAELGQKAIPEQEGPQIGD